MLTLNFITCVCYCRLIRHSNLFYCHPNLMHKLGVYSTVLKLMKAFLGSSNPLPHRTGTVARAKLNLNLLEEGGPPMPVEHCCKFLCKFAKINQENQRALFKHISYILECADKFPGTEGRAVSQERRKKKL